MANDAHNVDPITDLNQKISVSDPSIVLTDNPKAPPLPILTPIGGFFNPLNITASVESVFERVKINGVSPTFKGSSIDFDLPSPPTVGVIPTISSITTFQAPPPTPTSPPIPALAFTPDTANESQSRNQTQVALNIDSVSSVEPPTLPIFGNEVIGDVTPNLKIFGNQTDTTPPQDLVRQGGGSSKLDELNNMNFVDSAANIFTPPESFGVPLATPKTRVPVLLRRGDGEKTCLIFVEADSAYVVEGASGDDHTLEKPEPQDYYTAGDSIYHPWRVLFKSSDEDVKSWSVVGGTVYTQDAPIVVEDAEVTGDSGYVLLKITRNSASRKATEAVVKFSETVPESDYTTQYRVLAYVSSADDNPVTQHQFEEIRIFESRVVVNGAFRLVGLEMSHRNYYELPP